MTIKWSQYSVIFSHVMIYFLCFKFLNSNYEEKIAMPTPVELLWKAVKEKQYADIQPLIELHPSEAKALVNSSHPVNGRSLLVHLIKFTVSAKTEKPRSLIEYLLKHPEINWNFQNPKTKETMISAILTTAAENADLFIIECLKDIPQFLVDGNQLTYELAVKI